ncbi:MAG: TIGR02099 family protein [Gammaproteobacteria bacterium RIFCSPHIGHO2_12_FULL_37_14]|nr:MAG: TIGR02099 family protein [Gammaproteobacteria bacterium RIFCSPHIGHO2_12_FULL_37_14]
MNIVKIFLVSLTKKTVYLIAIGIVIVGLLIGASPLLSPILNKHTADLEQWASHLLGVPVTIHEVQLSWHRYQPEISLKEVTFLNKETKDPILQIRDIGILVSIFQSLWQQRFVPSGVIISGTNLTIHRAASNEISAQGFPIFGGYNQQPFEQETKVTEMIAWLSTPTRIILRDINIRYSDFTNQKQFVTLNNLSLENNGDKHTILGSAILHQDIPTEMTIATQWVGNTIDLTKIKARVYLYVSGFLLSQWVKAYSWNGWQVNEGILSAKIWGTWSDGVFKRIQVNFQSYGLDLYSQADKSIHKVNRLSGHIGWKRDGENQILAGEDILIDLPSHLWPVTSFYLKLVPQNNKVLPVSTNASQAPANHFLIPQDFKISYLDLQDVQTFLFSSPFFLPKETYEWFTQLKLKGGLQDVSLIFSGPWKDWSQVSLVSDFRQLEFSPWRQFPGMRNLSGTIRWNGQQGDLSFQSNRLMLQYDTVFKKPISIDQLIGEVKWQQDEKNQWIIQIPAMQLLNLDGALNINATFSIPNNSSPRIDLTSHFVLQKADHIIRYLPMRMFDSELETWLNHAFLGGDINSGNIEFHGNLNDFPFDNGKGSYSISAKVNNLDLNYAPGWPRLHHISGGVAFSGRKISVMIDHAFIKDIPVKNVRGEIPYLGDDKPQILSVEMDAIQTDFTNGLRLIHASPLENTLGKIFSKIEIRGLANLKLGLIIPLRYPQKTQIKGELQIPDAQLNLPQWHLTLDHLKGILNFSEDTATAKNLQGELFKQPVNINVTTLPKAKDITIIQAEFSSHLSMTNIENWLKIPFSSVVQGATDVITKINLSFKAPLSVQFSSNLVGVSLQIPDPYKKGPSESRNFSADIIISDNEPLRIKLIYDNLFSAALITERKNDKFKLLSVNFRLGGGDPSWPVSSGLYITGELDQIDWDKIKQYASQSEHTHLANLSLRAVDIKTNMLDIFGQHLNDVHLKVIPEQQAWKIDISSAEVEGQLHVPMKINSHELIDAQFKRLGLHGGNASATETASIDIRTLPAISLVADDFRYDDMPFGTFTFKAVPDQHGLSIRTFGIVSQQLDLRASGLWSYSNKTHFQGNAISKNVSGLINSLGLDAHNFIASDGKLNFDLNWRGAPYAPSLASMNGHAELQLGKGRIVEVAQTSGTKMGIGRMLSIFSLQTIPRRLMFDFSDLFQKGYSFDNVRGDFSLNQGSAYTTNFRFDGPLARVAINGRIGLQRKDYDLTLSVTPYVSSGLPIAAGFLTGGPIGGAAALAVSTFLGPAVSKAATYYYAVKGPWDNPSWETVDVPKKDSPSKT